MVDHCVCPESLLVKWSISPLNYFISILRKFTFCSFHKFSITLPRQRRCVWYKTFNTVTRTRWPPLSIGNTWKCSRHRSPRSPAHTGHGQRSRPALHQQQNLGIFATWLEGKGFPKLKHTKCTILKVSRIQNWCSIFKSVKHCFGPSSFWFGMVHSKKCWFVSVTTLLGYCEHSVRNGSFAAE